MMTALVTMAVGGSFPFFLSPTPDLYYTLVISRYVTKCLQVSPSVSNLLSLPPGSSLAWATWAPS